ncbi:ParB/RepB/Spo0J family partition protein [Alkalibacillus haloalkaliphilus]|uniref:ParB/RepB/Spo0J family partition protein n=1 Tax=Alkalibacillus haloalkaliphilus TaxID=94136 RepID=UPI0003065A61|nr:ParB/RepB/Spo0J family partition protein [Alkalibacillus haloalkaliphilus]
MEQTKNLLKNRSSYGITETGVTKKLTVRGHTDNYTVYKVPLELLFYNNQNGRIATAYSQYLENKPELNYQEDLEKYNEIFHEFIVKSDETAFKRTKGNIKTFGQEEPAVILQDGRVVDGNRRFTCLRELNKEGITSYLEAVILDATEGITDKDIKKLELQLQHAKERPEDYNPIDYLVDVYRDIIKNKHFTIKEYMKSTGKTNGEVTKLRDKAQLMVEFLEFINANEKFHIARNLKIDGPLEEINKILKKVNKEDEKQTVKESLFALLLNDELDDKTRKIREIGKELIITEYREKFLDEIEDYTDEIHDSLNEERQTGIESIVTTINNKTSINHTSISENIDNLLRNKGIEGEKAKPLEHLDKINRELDSLDVNQVKFMDDENKEKFVNQLSKSIDRMNHLLEY